MVALHVRAWVEIRNSFLTGTTFCVALHVRAWVEIGGEERMNIRDLAVALHVRAWVEILKLSLSPG